MDALLSAKTYGCNETMIIGKDEEMKR